MSFVRKCISRKYVRAGKVVEAYFNQLLAQGRLMSDVQQETVNLLDPQAKRS